MTIEDRQYLMEKFRSKCREHGLRVTPQRVMIYEELLKSSDHPSPDQLYSRLKLIFPELSFDTVYRTLSTFSEIGLIDLVEGYGTSMRFDPKLEKHHHFRCKKCGKITDFNFQHYDELKVPKDIAKKCEIMKLQVTIEGLCEKCKNRNI